MGFKNTTTNNKYSAVPEELRKLKNWVCWKAVPDERSHSGISKKPINAVTGEYAKSNDPSTWTDFQTAVSASVHFAGIGFMFGNSPYFGVDLDDMPEDLEDYRNGGADNRIAEFVHELQSYAEYSQSGNGIHIICRGTLPKGARHKKPVEMYETGRFFVMSGNPCSQYKAITDCTESIKPLHAKYLGGGREPAPRIAHQVNLASVNDIINAAENAKNGDKFRRLYGGDWSDYTSASEGDMALCNMLAFWTGCDADKMDAVFRQSGLMRDKWDERHGANTYGANTIRKAIAGCTQSYCPGNNAGDGYSLTIKSGEPGEISQAQPNYSMDDMGNAQRFVNMFGENIRYSYTDKKWYYYNSQKWCTDADGTVERLADHSVEAMKDEAKRYIESDGEDGDMTKAFQKHMKASRSNKSRKAMLEMARHHVPILPFQLDRYKMALNTPSGVLSLKSGELKEHKPEYYLTKITNVDYSANADCPKWHEFLSDIFDGDKDLIRYIQKAVGYTLTGSIAEQCVFFLYGTGRNGKSTFLDVIRDVFGDYAANIQPETIMVKSNTGSAINSDIARLKGARLVTSVEPNEGVRINEGLLKQLTGDDPVTARKLYSEEFEFKPEFKLWMATNHKPIIRGTDTGIWRRIHMIPFTVQIPEEKVDKNLKHKLKAEMTGIFKWCVDGCLLWQSEGLKMPRAVLDSVKEYRREMDVISAFIEDRCQLSGSVQSSTLYAAYASWAEENNEYRMSATKFGLEMAKRFDKVKGRTIFYNGLSLYTEM